MYQKRSTVLSIQQTHSTNIPTHPNVNSIIIYVNTKREKEIKEKTVCHSTAAYETQWNNNSDERKSHSRHIPSSVFSLFIIIICSQALASQARTHDAPYTNPLSLSRP